MLDYGYSGIHPVTGWHFVGVWVSTQWSDLRIVVIVFRDVLFMNDLLNFYESLIWLGSNE